MKRLMTVGALALFRAGSATAWAAEIYELGVDGLACPYCAYGLEKALTKVAGVESLDILINEGTCRVVMRDGATLSEDAARRIVADAGFTLRAFERVEASQ